MGKIHSFESEIGEGNVEDEAVEIAVERGYVDPLEVAESVEETGEVAVVAGNENGAIEDFDGRSESIGDGKESFADKREGFEVML